MWLERRVLRAGGLLLAALLVCGAQVAFASEDDGVGADQLELARQAEVLRFVTLSPNPPFAFDSRVEDGLFGYDVDLAREIGRLLGLQVEFVIAQRPEEMRAILQRGEAHAGIATTVMPEFVPPMGTSDPYLIGELSLLVASPLAERITDPRELNEPKEDGSAHVIAVVRNHVALAALEEHVPEATRRTFGEPADAIHALRGGEVDAVAYDMTWLLSYQQARDTGDATHLLPVPLDEIPHHILTRPDQPRLLERLNGAIGTLADEGTLENLAEHYLATQEWREAHGYPFDYTDERISDRFERLSVIFTIVAVVVLAVVFVLLIIYLNRAHRRQEEQEQEQEQSSEANATA